MENINPLKELNEKEPALRARINEGDKVERLLRELDPYIERLRNQYFREFCDASENEVSGIKRRIDALQDIIAELAEVIRDKADANADLTRLETAVEWMKKQTRRLRA